MKLLLEAGFSVRGTVRSESKTAHLKELFKGYGDNFETVVVADMTKVNVLSSPLPLQSMWLTPLLGGCVRAARYGRRRYRPHRIARALARR